MLMREGKKGIEGEVGIGKGRMGNLDSLTVTSEMC